MKFLQTYLTKGRKDVYTYILGDFNWVVRWMIALWLIGVVRYGISRAENSWEILILYNVISFHIHMRISTKFAVFLLFIIFFFFAFIRFIIVFAVRLHLQIVYIYTIYFLQHLRSFSFSFLAVLQFSLNIGTFFCLSVIYVFVL